MRNYQKLNLHCSSRLSTVSPDPAGLHDQQDYLDMQSREHNTADCTDITVTGIIDTGH